MKKQIKRIEPISAAKIAGLLYMAIGVILSPIWLILSVVGEGFGGLGLLGGFIVGLMIIVFYAVIGFLGAALTAWLYNVFAPRVGGIEVEVSDNP